MAIMAIDPFNSPEFFNNKIILNKILNISNISENVNLELTDLLNTKKIYITEFNNNIPTTSVPSGVDINEISLYNDRVSLFDSSVYINNDLTCEYVHAIGINIIDSSISIGPIGINTTELNSDIIDTTELNSDIIDTTELYTTNLRSNDINTTTLFSTSLNSRNITIIDKYIDLRFQNAIGTGVINAYSRSSPYYNSATNRIEIDVSTINSDYILLDYSGYNGTAPNDVFKLALTGTPYAGQNLFIRFVDHPPTSIDMNFQIVGPDSNIRGDTNIFFVVSSLEYPKALLNKFVELIYVDYAYSGWFIKNAFGVSLD